jgi:predicted nucleotidyltransferase
MPLHAQAIWRQRFADDRQALERRRGQGLEQARQAAVALAARWPDIRQVWIFGSVLGPGFREHSDLDLLVEGLPANSVIEALGLAEQQGPMAVDLKRAEDLEPELCQRLLRRSRALLRELCPEAGGQAYDAGGHGGAA